MAQGGMRLGVVAATAALSACIPQVDPPYRAAPPPPAEQAWTEQPPVGQAYPDQPPIDSRDWRPQQDDPGVSALPAPRPAWDARPVAPDAQEVRDQTYVVRPGDTLGRISNATGAGADAIARANGLSPPFRVVEARRLSIPGGRYHLVRPGESGIAIARAYGLPWAQVVEANGLVEPFILRAGQRVLIPGLATAAPPPPLSAAERAARFRLDIDDILTGGEPALPVDKAPAKPAPTAARVLPPTAVVAPPTRLSGGFAWPVEGRITARFGPGASGERQNGVNIAVPLGSPIGATADGVVAYAGSGIASLGGLVIVKHGGGWTSVYGYAARLLVQRGQAVKKGQPIAVSGQTGNAERPSVHFELRKGRTPVDPLGQLPAR